MFGFHPSKTFRPTNVCDLIRSGARHAQLLNYAARSLAASLRAPRSANNVLHNVMVRSRNAAAAADTVTNSCIIH